MPDYYEKKIGLMSRLPAKGDVFIDVGANEGAWTLHFAPNYGKVYAFEPDDRPYVALEANVKAAGLTNVTLSRLAIWDKEEALTMERFGNTQLTTAFVDKLNPVPPTHVDKITAKAVPLDLYIGSLLKGHESATLKIDVEGAELEVLSGAQGFINAFHPFILVEIHSTANKVKAIAWLQTNGYSVEVVRNPGYAPDSQWYDFHMWLLASYIPQTSVKST